MERDVLDEYIKLDEKDDKELIEYFNEDEIQVFDLVNAVYSLLEEKEELERKIREDYVQKEIDPYEEYGISENDFH